ncbi:MAG: HU family DNA-binding protein [Planctomycetota bacterium]
MITKKDLIGRITRGTQAKRALVEATVQNFLSEITAELTKGNRLEFRDFGVFEIREQVLRTAHNPKTLEKIEVPAKRIVKFKMGWLMREKLSDQAYD